MIIKEIEALSEEKNIDQSANITINVPRKWYLIVNVPGAWKLIVSTPLAKGSKRSINLYRSALALSAVLDSLAANQYSELKTV